MGMSTNIVGIVPADEKFKEMKLIWDTCIKNKVKIPKEVEKFFNDETPDSAGVVIDIEDLCDEYNTEYASGFEIKVEDIPKDVKIIRFYNSY
jgi:hypothetical protein